jgi:hypothetical protein
LIRLFSFRFKIYILFILFSIQSTSPYPSIRRLADGVFPLLQERGLCD